MRVQRMSPPASVWTASTTSALDLAELAVMATDDCEWAIAYNLFARAAAKTEDPGHRQRLCALGNICGEYAAAVVALGRVVKR